MGHIVYFHVEEWALANEFTHQVGIVNIFADPAGTRLVFVDVKGQGYVYNAVSKKIDNKNRKKIIT